MFLTLREQNVVSSGQCLLGNLARWNKLARIRYVQRGGFMQLMAAVVEELVQRSARRHGVRKRGCSVQSGRPASDDRGARARFMCGESPRGGHETSGRA